MRKRSINHSEIIRLYCEEGLSGDAIAKKFGVNHSLIFDTLRKNGVRVRKRGGPRKVLSLDVEKIKEMYLSGMDGTDIAKEYGVSFSSIYSRLHKARVLVKERPRVIDVDEAIRLYCDEGMPTSQVAKVVGAHQMSVWRHLSTKGLTREYSEARKGSRNPAWRGGIAYGKYCPKFNDLLKEQVRRAFGRKCFLCGASEDGVGLDVHHCDYHKGQGCGRAWTLIPLCKSCHSKTGFNRYYWFAKLANYWVGKHIQDGINI